MTDTAPLTPAAQLKKILAADFFMVAGIAAWLTWFVFYNLNTPHGAHIAHYVFLLVFISFFSAVFPSVFMVQSRIALLRGKWRFSGGEAVSSSRPPRNIWHYVAPPGWAAGAAAAFLLCFGCRLLHIGSDHPIVVGLLGFAATLVINTTILQCCFLHDMRAFAAALAQPPAGRAPSFTRYFLIEHTLPRFLLVSMLNISFALRSAGSVALKNSGRIPLTTFSLELFTMLAIVIPFMCISSQAQVRPDVHLGKISVSGRTPMPARRLCLLLLSLCLLPVVVLHAVSAAIGTTSLSVTAALTVKITLASIGIPLGCRIGIRWGARQEHQVLREGKT